LRTPGEGRYAQLEREQRWLAESLPRKRTGPTEIVDRYIIGTRLRLRCADDVYKLCQKVPAGPDAVKLTNIYLSPEEYAVFLELPARLIAKRRWQTQWEGHDVAVDEFVDRSLILAEVELTADEPYLAMPPFCVKDVTGDETYTGGALAL
jgi:CYTH domain-containing protein